MLLPSSLSGPGSPAPPSLPFFFAAMVLSESRPRAAPLTQNTAFPAGVHDGRSEDPGVPVCAGRLRLSERCTEEILAALAPRRPRAFSRRRDVAIGLARVPSRRLRRRHRAGREAGRKSARRPPPRRPGGGGPTWGR